MLTALSMVAVAAGRRALLWSQMPLHDASLAERTVFRAAVGFGLLQFIFFALAAAGVLSPRSLQIAALLVAALCGYDIALLGRGAARAGKEFLRQRIPALGWALLLVAAAVLLCRFAYLLCPPVDYDGLFYHLTAPKRYLEQGGFVYLPALTCSNYPLGWEMLMGVCLALVDDTSAKGVHYIAGLLLLLTVYALGARLSGRKSVGAVSAALTLPFMESGMSWGYVDLAHSFYFCAATLAFLRYVRTRDSRDLFLCAVLSGLTACVKISGLCAPVLFAFLATLSLREFGTTWRSILRTMVPFLIVGFLPVAPWLLKTWVITGNPVYPMLSQLFPTPDWYPLVRADFHEFHQKFQWARFSNWNGTTRSAILLVTVTVIVAATLLTASRLKRGGGGRYAVLVLGTFLLLTVSSTGLYQRYVMYLMPLTVALTVSVVASWRREGIWMAGGVALCLCTASLFKMSGGLPEAVRTAFGVTTRREYLEKNMTSLAVWDAVNALPPSAQVLSLSDRTYYSDRFCYVATPLLQGRFRYDDYANFSRDVERDGITHVVTPAPGSSADATSRFAVARNGAAFVDRLVHTRGELLLYTESYSLYKLRPAEARK